MRKKTELSRLNVGFCLLVVFIHVLSEAVGGLRPGSCQHALVYLPQRLAFVAVPGFFFLSGLKLTLSRRPFRLGPYYWGRVRRLLLPYLLAVLVYFLYLYPVSDYGFSLSALGGFLRRGDLAAQFYFLYPLAQFILLTPLFRHIVERRSPTLLLPAATAVTLLSSMFLPELVRTVVPGAAFARSGMVFTSYLLYYLAGCYAGRYYPAFTKLLRENRVLIYVLAAVFALADAAASYLDAVGLRQVGYLPILHLLYFSFAILCLYDLALGRAGKELPRAAAAVDRAGFLIYLYHVLVILVLDQWMSTAGLSDIGARLALRLALVFPATAGLCVLWQTLWRQVFSHKPQTEKEEPK